MNQFATRAMVVGLAAVSIVAGALSAQSAVAQKPFEPKVGQPGKDVVWVPTPQPTVDKMLELAKLTKDDYLIDLGSGDGVTVITAALRGARALGIEYNPDMVALATARAQSAGVTERAVFLQADIFKTDFSQATVLTMFLLPDLNSQLRPMILNMKPGTRVVSNTFTMGDWEPDQSETAKDCPNSWCTALLWIVPAKVGGSWMMDDRPLTFRQKFQVVTGSLGESAISEGRLSGRELTFKVDRRDYIGRVSADGKTITGTDWAAARQLAN